MDDSRWPDEHVATLIQARRDGLSGAEIAKTIFEAHRKRYSRSAVCGKAYRLGLSFSAKDLSELRSIAGRKNIIAIATKAAEDPDFYRNRSRKAWTTRMSAEPKARATRPPRIPTSPFAPLPDTSPIPFLDRKRCQCSWPVAGQGASLMVCAEPVAARWCADHDRIGLSK